MMRKEVAVSYECIILEKKDGIAIITLNRPEVLNAMNYQLMRELRSALEDVRRDENVRVVVLTGAGRAFCAGEDLKDFAAGRQQEKDIELHEIPRTMEVMGKPLIAAVNGHCYTGGFELAMLCDMIFASETAVFADTHVRYGLIHGWGGCQRLTRLVGAMRAMEIILSCKPIDAREAERIGLVNRVVPADKLMETVQELAADITRHRPDVVRVLWQLIRTGTKADLATALELERATYEEGREQRLQEAQAGAGQFVGRGR